MTYREDCDKLEELGIPLPAQCYVPSRDFQSSKGTRALLSTRPSAAVCAELWTDLFDASHSDRHEPVAGCGRSCRCPLWSPAQRRTWQEEVDSLRERHGLSLEDLVRVLDMAFPRSTALAGASESILRLPYDCNWIWYTRKCVPPLSVFAARPLTVFSCGLLTRALRPRI